MPHLGELMKYTAIFHLTSLQARSADLPSSPAGLHCRFATSGFALCARISFASLARVSCFALTKIFEKKRTVSQSTQNSLKRIEIQKKFTSMTDYAPSGVVQNPSGEAQPYLPHVTRGVPMSVHAKFHADWTKNGGARGIQTNKQTDGQSYFNNVD